MIFAYCGIDFKKASLAVRDGMAWTDSLKLSLLEKMAGEGISEAMILTTCNRSEMYFFCENEEKAACGAKHFMEIFPGLKLEPFMDHLENDEAYRRLFRVCAGLESQVIGEDQILGQVKDALDFSRTMGCNGKCLDRTVQEAVSCGKRIRSELKISEVPLSVVYIGVKQLEEQDSIKDKNVLIIGSGRTGSLALKYVMYYGAGNVTICNRTRSRSEDLKAQYPELKVIDFDERYQYMPEMDVVISATECPHLMVKKDRFVPVKPMHFLDLAVPRDIDPALESDSVQLIDMDRIRDTVSTNQHERERLALESRHIVDEAVDELKKWMAKSRVDDTIESLQMRCKEIEEDSFNYINRKLDLTEREKLIVRRSLSAALKRLLHDPILELKKIEDAAEQNEAKAMVERLFQLENVPGNDAMHAPASVTKEIES